MLAWFHGLPLIVSLELLISDDRDTGILFVVDIPVIPQPISQSIEIKVFFSAGLTVQCLCIHI